ncbi:glycosyl transferase family 1 [Sulfolobus acidocaldarius SUSAZ]|nr:glycosyl transferase family 1 [Sulfolobus acidocaldarius SUSAZ]
MFRTLSVIIKLLPRVIKIRNYRNAILNNEQVDEKEMEKEAEKLVDTLISLGPIFIKFGQLLSVHSDILPQPYLKALSRLQDDVDPPPWEEIKKILEEDLGNKLNEYEIDLTPISSASIGVVYIAKRKKDGKLVVIKVNRPNIKEMANQDVNVLKSLAPLTKYVFDESFYESFKVLVDNFGKKIYEEMDFTIEEFHMKKIKEEMSDYPWIRIPEPYLATKRVLIMEYVKGYKVTSEEAKRIMRAPDLSYMVFRTFMVMLLTKEYFHADPHPGNIALDEKGNLILYDFGIVGRMDRDTRLRLLRAYGALLGFDSIGLVKVLEELGAIQPEADREILAKGIGLFLEQFQGITPETLEVEQFLEAANEVFYRFPLKIPDKLAIYIRMTSILGGTCTRIDPEFNFFLNLQKLVEEEGLLFEAMINDMRSTISSAIQKFRLSLLEKPILLNKKSTSEKISRYLSFSFIVIALLTYLYDRNSILPLLIAIIALVIIMNK